MRKALFLFAFVFFPLLTAAFAGPAWLRPRIEKAGSALCGDCALTIGALGPSFFPLGLRARSVKFRQGDARDSAVSVALNDLLVPVSLASLRGGPLRIGFVELRGLSVTVHEGDAHLPEKAKPEEESEGFEVEGLHVLDGDFTYRKDSPAGVAYIHVLPVSAVIGPFGTSERLRDQPLVARAQARLEKTGEVTLAIGAKFFAPVPYADVDLRLRGLELREVNPYFRLEEGVELAGHLIDSHVLVSVRGRRAEGTVRARYENLRLDFFANRHRGGLSAFLDNLAAKLALKGANDDDPPSLAVKAVVTARHGRESVVSFILRTMKEASLRVAKR